MGEIMTNKTITGLGLMLCLLVSGEMATANLRTDIFNEVQLPQEFNDKVIGTRLSDMVEVSPKLFPGIANINEIFKKDAEKILNISGVEVIHDVFFASIPNTQNGINQLELIALVKYKNGEMQFEKLSISFSNSSLNLADYQISKVVLGSIRDMNFEFQVGLVERKLIIEDKAKNVKLVFPIGVGSFDEGVMNEGKTSLLTPRFQNGFLDKRVVISQREKPKYFKGKPFIRILKGQDVVKDMTPIGFHIEINNSFVRGFDSHGCMRLREMDLMALHDIIMLGTNTQLPIKVLYNLEDKSDSPIPKRNKSFKTILNKGSKEAPFFILDRDNLVQTSLVESRVAPVDQLIDDSQDNYEDIFSYDTNAQIKEQDIRRENECKVKVMNGQIKNDDKSFQKCMDEGKRKDSMADRIYRKYMGIDSLISPFDFLN